MRKITITAVRSIACFSLFVLLLTAPASAQPSGSITKEPTDQLAMDILLNMARTISGAKQFSVTLRSSYDAPQENGQMIEFAALRKIRVNRPDNLRIDLRRSNGDQRTLILDGKQVLIHNITENVYATAEKPGSVEAAVKYLVGALKTPLPLAKMFLVNFPAELEQMVEDVEYVELNKLTDVETDHLSVRARDVDFQIWIGRSKPPLPQRIVISYKNSENKPQFRADFSNWNLTASAVKSPFTYTLPQNAEKIPLLIRSRSESLSMEKEGGTK